MKISTLIRLCLLSGVISGCTQPKLPVPEPNPPVVAVQENIAAFSGQSITWGGIILETHTSENMTEITILSKRLTKSTRPTEQDESLGRFIAQAPSFLDPALYAKDREITIHGQIQRAEKRKIGDFDYTYPIVRVDDHFLWQPRVENTYYDPWYGPWYNPWYGPWYYPHYHPRTIDSVTVPK